MTSHLELAKALALEAGAIMLENFGPSTEHRLKDDRSPVSDADTRINAHVIERISRAFPEHSLLGEEGEVLSDSSHVWVFDPIDGTIPYVRGIPTNVFSLALVIDGVPTLGVVYDPHLKRLYHAIKGEGAFLNDTRISTMQDATLDHGFIEVSGKSRITKSTLYDELRNAGVHLLSFYSTIYAQMLVACGQIEGALYLSSKPWDCAAAKVIVEEAGGITSDLAGNDQRYDGPLSGFVSGANAQVHERLLAIASVSFDTSRPS